MYLSLYSKGERNMKILFTKYVCDICGKEINPEDGRRMVAFGIGEWDRDEDLSSCAVCTKDVCPSCYDTLRSLVGELKVEETKVEPEKKRGRGNYDANLVVDLWKKGLTRDEIVAKVGCTKAQANYAVKKAQERGEVRNAEMRKEMSAMENSGPIMETVVDETGVVVETRWV